MKKQTNSKFDILVERLVEEFVKIPNFELTQTDQKGNIAFNVITYRIAEVASYKDLVCQHFFPATNKAIFAAKKDFQNSKYKFLLSPNQIDFGETLYETVRLAYVGLFHKLENYVNDVLRITDLIFEEIFETDGTVAQWAKNKFEFDLKDWHQFKIVYKINWICNCVKHKDGYPIKEPKPIEFQNIDEKKRIKIPPQEFKLDCEELIKFYPLYLQLMFLFAQHKMATEKPISESIRQYNPQQYEELVEKLNDLELATKRMVELLKGL